MSSGLRGYRKRWGGQGQRAREAGKGSVRVGDPEPGPRRRMLGSALS